MYIEMNDRTVRMHNGHEMLESSFHVLTREIIKRFEKSGIDVKKAELLTDGYDLSLHVNRVDQQAVRYAMENHRYKTEVSAGFNTPVIKIKFI